MIEPDERADELAHAVIGASIEVHRRLGPGHLESVYENALAIEMELRKIPFERQRPFDLLYRDQPVGEGRMDFLAGGLLVIELKAVDTLAPIHKVQVLSYLKATGLQLGLLINFNVPVLREGIQRIVNTQ